MLLPYGASQYWLRAPEFVLPPDIAAGELLAFEDLILEQPNLAVRRALLQRGNKWEAKQAGKARRHRQGLQRPGGQWSGREGRERRVGEER
jgi:hypothetical protein